MRLTLAVVVAGGLQCTFAHSIPIGTRQSSLPACDFGFSYLVCADGYTGCFSEAPYPSRNCSPACPDGAKTATIFRPLMYTLSPAQPQLAQLPSSCIEIQNQPDKPIIEQAIAFRGIPKVAKTCTFRWAQAAEAERNFSVDGSGLVKLTHLTGIPDHNAVSAANVAPLEVPSQYFNVDFTSWDAIPNATTHTGSTLNCSEAIHLKASLNLLNGGGHVFFEQDRRNGFYIEYSC